MAYLATIAAFGFDDFNPSTLLRVYYRLGCRAAQFYRNERNPPDPDDARRLVEDIGMPFDSIHGVFGPQYDPSSPDEAIRKSAVDVYRREGELALRLGGPQVVVHPAPPAEYASQVTAVSRAARVDPMCRTIDELAAIGADLGVIYLIENIPANYHFGSDPMRLAEMVRAVDSPYTRMCVDTGHAHMTAGVAEAFDACRDVIGYIHVNDNPGDIDSHLAPGDGTIDWTAAAACIAKFPANMPAMLELFYPEADMVAKTDAGYADDLVRYLAINAVSG
jgi:sugar phosphate isomerase/epimerase